MTQATDLNIIESDFMKHRTEDLNQAVKNEASVQQGKARQPSLFLLGDEEDLDQEEEDLEAPLEAEALEQEEVVDPEAEALEQEEAVGPEAPLEQEARARQPQLQLQAVAPVKPFEPIEPEEYLALEGAPEETEPESVIKPEGGGFFDRAGHALKQLTLGAISDVIVNTLALAVEGGQVIRDAEVPGFEKENGEPLTVQDVLEAAGLAGKVEIEVEKLEASGRPGVRIARALAGFIASTVVLKKITGAGNIASAAGADLLAVDREANLSSLVNELTELDPGIAQTVVDFLDNRQTDSQTRKALNNVLEGLGLGALFTVTWQSIKAMKNAGTKLRLDEKGLLVKKPEPKTIRKAPVEATEEELKKFVDIKGRTIDINERYAINWRTQAAPTEAKLVRGQHRKDIADEIEAGIPERMKMTNPEIAKEASERLSKNPQGEYDAFINRDVSKEFIDPVDTAIARKLADDSAIHLYDLAQAVDSRIVEGAEEEFLEHLARSALIEQKAQLHSLSAGRNLQAFKIELSDIQGGMKIFRDKLAAFKETDKLRPSQDALIVAKRLLNTIESPEQLKAIQMQMARSTKTEMLVEFWINGLLSSPATHQVNIVSNAMTTLWMIPERAVASRVTQAARLFGRDVNVGGSELGEAAAMTYGLGKGIMASYKLMFKNLGKVLRGKEVDVKESQKIENFRRKAITAENLGVGDSNPLRGAFNMFGEAVRSPGKLLATADDFFKGIGYHMETQRAAFVAAIDAGYGKLAKGEKINGLTRGEFIADFVQNPPASVTTDAQNFGKYITFTNELGVTGKKFQDLRNVHPGFSFVVPFFKTIANIYKFTFTRLPGLNLLSKNLRADIAAGGARRDMAIAKTGMGSMMLLMGGLLNAEGRITGSGVTNKDMQKLRRNLNVGYQDNSWVEFDEDGNPKKYFALDRLDPVLSFLTLGASVGELVAHLGEEDQAELLAGATLIIRDLTINKTFMRGIAEAISAIEDNNLLGFGSNFVGSFVPAIVAQGEKALSPGVTDIKTPDPATGADSDIQKTLQALEKIIDRFRSRIPWMSDKSNNFPLRDFWGEAVIYEPAWPVPYISPIYTKSKKKDLVNDELIRLKVPISRLKPKLMGVDLTRAQFDKYQILFGHRTNGVVEEESGHTLHRALTELIKSEDYETEYSDGDEEGNPGSREKIILSYIQGYKKLAAFELIQEFPELETAILRNRLKEKFAQLPEDQHEDAYRQLLSSGELDEALIGMEIMQEGEDENVDPPKRSDDAPEVGGGFGGSQLPGGGGNESSGGLGSGSSLTLPSKTRGVRRR